ncbi:LytTR family transcriptional regulator [Cereibacter sphaeroides]|nr:LytTR family transcriptional regulator [Cereibacter sphaeroides]
MTVKDSALRLAMRELQSLLRRPGTPVIVAAVIGVLAISGPFGTVESMGFATRLLYWAVIVGVTLLSGWFVSLWLVHVMIRRGWGKPAIWALVSLAVAGIVAVEVALVNIVAFGIWPVTGEAILSLLLSTVPIALIVTAVFTWGPTVKEPGEAPATAVPQPPRLLSRLPLDKRGPLIALSVQDHYVEVVTTKGRELLLMRLGDAMAETEGCAGLQVHRSHWVALGQVQAARREGARGVLTMSDGREIPVSRTYLPDAKEAGLL